MPSSREPDASAPRIVGFDVPPLHKTVDPLKDEAIVATLDIAPSDEWRSLFDEKCLSLGCELGFAGIKMQGASISFYGSVRDARRLADRIMAFVQQVTIELVRGSK